MGNISTNLPDDIFPFGTDYNPLDDYTPEEYALKEAATDAWGELYALMTYKSETETAAEIRSRLEKLRKLKDKCDSLAAEITDGVNTDKLRDNPWFELFLMRYYSTIGVGILRADADGKRAFAAYWRIYYQICDMLERLISLIEECESFNETDADQP